MQLHASTNLVSVPVEFTFPRGATEYTVEARVANNDTIEGPRPVKFSVGAAGFSDSVHWIAINDDDTATVTVIAPAEIREGDAAAITIQLSKAPAAAIPIYVTMEPPIQNSTIPSYFPANTSQISVWVGYADNRLGVLM